MTEASMEPRQWPDGALKTIDVFAKDARLNPWIAYLFFCLAWNALPSAWDF